MHGQEVRFVVRSRIQYVLKNPGTQLVLIDWVLCTNLNFLSSSFKKNVSTRRIREFWRHIIRELSSVSELSVAFLLVSRFNDIALVPVSRK